MNPKVNFFFEREKRWQEEFRALRGIVLDCGLSEVVKWGQACYTSDDRNIVLIHGFKEYCALLFFKGALLSDPNGILIQQTENVQSARQIRFTNVRDIVKSKKMLKAYIKEAIEVERSGLKVTFRKTSEFTMPDEFINRLNASAALKRAFHALTPGRQRAYIFYFSSAKQPKTRESRVDKNIARILEGKGLDD